MTETVVGSVIAGLFALVGSFFASMLASRAQAKKQQHEMEVNQAVTNTKIDELTREVRTHNNFAQRVPVLEEQIKVINHRLSDLERG